TRSRWPSFRPPLPARCARFQVPRAPSEKSLSHKPEAAPRLRPEAPQINPAKLRQKLISRARYNETPQRRTRQTFPLSRAASCPLSISGATSRPQLQSQLRQDKPKTDRENAQKE